MGISSRLGVSRRTCALATNRVAAEEVKTLTLGSQVFIGQFVTDWNAVLSALSLAILPVLVLYVIFSRQLIRGITSGAVK